MDMSFEEKRVWIQLVSLVVGLGGYLVVAGLMLSNGVSGAIMALVLSVGGVWVAHLLLISLFGSEVTKDVLQIVYYRRGI